MSDGIPESGSQTSDIHRDREQRPVARYACDRCGVGNHDGRPGWRCDVCRLGHLVDRFPAIMVNAERQS